MSFLLRHLTTVHSTRPGFFFACGLNRCERTFRNMMTYKHHVYALHTKDHTNLSTSDQHNNFSDQPDSPDEHSNSECEDKDQNDDEEDPVCDAISDGLEGDSYAVGKEGDLLLFGVLCFV